MGLLGINDTERAFVSTVGQQVVYDAVGELVSRYNAELQKMMSLFVEQTTENHKERYKLPGGGRLQKMSGEAPSAEVKAYGGWDVAYPLEQFGASLGGSRVNMAYMTVQDLNRHVQTVFLQDQNTTRFEILRRLLNNAQRSFSDPLWGSLAVEALANGDTVLYPPVIGSEDEATENHMYISGYTAANISDTNNPFKTIATELEEHFGKPIGGSNIIAFINSTHEAKVTALTDFVEVPDRFIRPGDDTAVPTNLPASTPGRVIGRVSGCWVSLWDWIPANYIYGQHLGATPPLKIRVDPSDVNLPRGLALVANSDRYPLQESHWEHRFGFGVGNRLNGVLLHLNASTFAIPTGYTY
jgi:hypothetical protein